MHKDQENKIIKNIFTESEINDLYNLINTVNLEEKTFVQKIFCHRAYFVTLPDSVLDKIKDVAKANFGPDIELTEVSFARYSYDMYRDGLAKVPPSLYPHCDNAFHEPRLTIDFQIKSNIDWPIIVEDREYLIKDNEAVSFSGTHQVHWRPHVEWQEDNFVDLIFTHFTPKGVESNILDSDIEHHTRMKKLTEYYLDKWNEIAPENQKAMVSYPEISMNKKKDHNE
jgi:hypothetical protein